MNAMENKETVKLRLWVNSDPYRLIQNIQQLDPSDVDQYIKDQAERLARNDAIKEVRAYPHNGTSYEAMARNHRVDISTKERIPGRLKQLSKYKIKIHRMIELGDGTVEITGERL